MKKVAVDYKGKHSIIHDEDCVGEFDYIDEYFDLKKVLRNDTLLMEYVADCNYYGVPTYVGRDDTLKKRIEQIQELIDKEEMLH